MSLELKIEQLTAALVQNNELLAISNAARAEAMAAIQANEGSEKPATTRTRRTKEQIAADTLAAAAPLVAETTKPAETVAEKPAPAVTVQFPTVDELRAAAVKYASADGEEKVRRTAFLKSVIEEVGIKPNEAGKSLITAADPEDRAKIIGWLEAFARGEKVNFSADDGDAPVVEDDDIG